MFFVSMKKSRSFLCTVVLLSAMLGTAHTALANPNLPDATKTGSGAAPNMAAINASQSQTIVLENGLTVYVLEDHRFPLVSVRLFVKAGSTYETPKDAGISHVLEHMVFKGTEKRPKGTIFGEIEKAGGSINAYTSFDSTFYMADLPAKHWALGLDVLKDIAFHPTFDATELESEKQVILSELQISNDDPDSKIFWDLTSNTLKGTTYDHHVLGFEETIKAVTPESLRQYLGKYYQPQNTTVVVVGDVDAKAVLAESQKLFGALKNSGKLHPVKPIDATKLNNTSVIIEEGPWQQVYLTIAFPIPHIQDAQQAAIKVFSRAFGTGTSSYLYKKYKYDKQLIDNITIYDYPYERVGALYIAVELNAKNLNVFWQEFVKDLATLNANLFSDADIARAKLLEEDDFYRAKETFTDIASNIGDTLLLGGGEQGEKNLLASMARVNKEDIQAVIQQWIVPQRANVIALIPQGTPLPDLKTVMQATWPIKETQKSAKASNDTGATEIIDLGQGRTVILIPDTTRPYTAINLYFSGGSALDTQHQGLGDLTAAVLTTGTKDLTASQLKNYLADRATLLDTYRAHQAFSLSTNQPSRFNKDIFALIREIITNPSMNPEEVEREKKDQIAAIRVRDDNSMDYIYARIAPFLFEKQHAYGMQHLGTIKEIEAYTVKDIQGFWQKQSKQPWVLSVAGDFDKEAVLAFAKSLPVPSAKAVTVKPPKWNTERKLNLTVPGREQAHYMLAFPSVSVDHEDAPAVELLGTVLGGFSGKLFKELRDNQGLAYTVYAYQNFFQETGVFLFYIGTDPQKLAASHDGFMGVIEDIQKNLISEKELQGAKNKMEGDYYLAQQRLSTRSGEAASNITYGQDLDFRMQTIAKVKKLTAEDVRRVAQKYLVVEDMYVIEGKP